MEDAIRILRDWAEQKRMVRRVFIFGSRARTDFTAASDLDIAVEIDGVHGSALSTWMFEAPEWLPELAAKLPYKIDLQQLDGDDTPIVKLAVARSSITAYERADLLTSHGASI